MVVEPLMGCNRSQTSKPNDVRRDKVGRNIFYIIGVVVVVIAVLSLVGLR